MPSTRPIRLEPFEPVLAGGDAFGPHAVRPAAPVPAPARRARRRGPLAASVSAGAPTELATVADAPPVGTAPSFALAVIGKPGGECYPLTCENVIGRAAAASISIDDPDISRLHVQLTVSGRRVQLVDLGSANGTFVNDARCHDAAVEPGDVIRLGNGFEARLVSGAR